MKKRKRRKIKKQTHSPKKVKLNKEKVLKVSEGVFSSIIDISLWIIAYCGNLMLPQSQFGASYRAAQNADRFLQEINYETFKNAINNARKIGLIASSKSGKKSWPEITKAGLKRLKNTLPFYDEKRVWDKRVYLITYDIPEKKRRDRNLFSQHLKRIGCGMLQKSVWITPYNPTETLHEFITERGLDASVIVSNIGTDGSIGNEDLKTLVARIYKLSELNKRYKNLLESIKKQKQIDNMHIVQYLSILSNDPQLPFVLLPSWWIGNTAWNKMKQYIRKW